MSEARERLVYEVARRSKRGEGIRAIHRALGLSRKTVRRMLWELEQRRTLGDDALAREQGSARTPRGSKLDRFAGAIQDLVQRFPDIRATRLHEELIELGFEGGYTIVREHLEKIRPKAPKRAARIVRTGPGVQGQFDWSPYRLTDGTRIYAFSCVLAFSRHLYVHFTTDMRQPTLFRELKHAFAYHGGIAAQYVTDSMPGIVDRWELDEPVLNLRAVDFAAYYDFAYHIAPRANGAYKGKVERRFRFLVESFFNGREFRTLDEANDTMAWWLQHRANARGFGIPRLSAAERLVEELPALRSLPVNPWDDREIAHRIVDGYGYAHLDGNMYRAARGLVGTWVYVRADEAEVEILGPDASRVERHRRAPRGAGLWVPPPEVDEKPARRCISDLVARFEAFGDTAHRYAVALRENKRYAGLELGRILALQEEYTAEDLSLAIAHAQRYAAYGADAVERVLRAKATPRTLAGRMADTAKEQIRRAMSENPVRQRDLADYAPYFAGSLNSEGACAERDDDPKDDQSTATADEAEPGDDTERS